MWICRGQGNPGSGERATNRKSAANPAKKRRGAQFSRKKPLDSTEQIENIATHRRTAAVSSGKVINKQSTGQSTARHEGTAR
jgi:hypothetical protein